MTNADKLIARVNLFGMCLYYQSGALSNESQKKAHESKLMRYAQLMDISPKEVSEILSMLEQHMRGTI